MARIDVCVLLLVAGCSSPDAMVVEPPQLETTGIDAGVDAADALPLIDAGVDTAVRACPAPPTCVIDAGPTPDGGGSALFPLLTSGARVLNVVADGDSRVLDAYLDGGAPWPQLAAMLAGPDVRIANVAQAGATTTTMMQRGAANVDPLFDAAATRNIAVVLIGVNDIRSFTSTSQLTAPESNLMTYGRARLAKGWELFLLPDLPAGLEQQAVWAAWVDFERTGPTASPPFASGILDIGAPFDDFALGVGKVWSVDGIHPSQAGCVRIADRVGHFIGAF